MSAPKILVVDDQPINVQLLKRKLEKEGMQVMACYSGREALDLVRKNRPDLILLDVMMPDVDGIEVCQALQADEQLKSVPVIFITARTSKEGKIEGLGVGAVDYITKPIDLDETLARVQTQLRFVKVNRELVELQRRLGEARNAAAIGAVTQGIAHNLNNLFGVIIGYIDLIKANADRPDVVRRHSASLEDASNRVVKIIRQLTSLVVKSRPPLTSAPVQQLIEGGIDRFRNEHKISQPITVENPLGEQPIATNTEVFEDVLAKLLINAWESYKETGPEQRPIKIRTEIKDREDEGSQLHLYVEDQGYGIDPEVGDHAFEPFISSKATVGVGMGLTVARHAIRGMGGEVSLANRRDSRGAVATIRHPVERRQRVQSGSSAAR